MFPNPSVFDYCFDDSSLAAALYCLLCEHFEKTTFRLQSASDFILIVETASFILHNLEKYLLIILFLVSSAPVSLPF